MKNRTDFWWLPYAGFALLAIFVLAQLLRGCADDGQAAMAHVSMQVHAGDSVQIGVLRRQAAFLKAEKFHDSIRDVAVQMQLEGLSRAVAQKSDSLAWLRRENERAQAERQRQDALFLGRFDALSSQYSEAQRRNLDSVSRKFARIERAISDSALTTRMAKASFEEVYKTASLNNDDFSSEVMFGKSDSGKTQASIVPMFKNKPGIEKTGYVPPKKGVPGLLRFNVTEGNRYAAQGSTNFEVSLPPLKGKPRKDKAIRAAKTDTRKRQRKNFNKTGG